MRQFWTIVPNAGYGVGDKDSRSNEPDLPAPVGERRYTMPGDLRVAENGHNHLVHGNALLPSTEAIGDEAHWHWMIPLPGGGVKQIYVGSGTSHTHTGELQTYRGGGDYVQPKYYILLITCDDAEFASLDAAGVDVYAERAASQDGEGNWIYAPLSLTTWGAGKKTAIQNRLHNALGLALPSIIDTDKEFMIWILDVGGWRPEQEDKHG